jgi:hypothetical protein
MTIFAPKCGPQRDANRKVTSVLYPSGKSVEPRRRKRVMAFIVALETWRTETEGSHGAAKGGTRKKEEPLGN